LAEKLGCEKCGLKKSDHAWILLFTSSSWVYRVVQN